MMRSTLLAPILLLGLSGVAAAQNAGVGDHGATPGYQVRRGEQLRVTDGDARRVVLHRTHAPDSGTWDNIQLQADPPGQLDGRTTLGMWVNIIPSDAAGPARLRRIDILPDDVSGTRVYEADTSAYRIDGEPVPDQLWIHFDRDPNTWQRLTLDLSSGPGLGPSSRVSRIPIQFTNPGDYYIRDVRLIGQSSNPSGNDDVLLETRGMASAWPWITSSRYRILFQCPPLPNDVTRPLAWASIDRDFAWAASHPVAEAYRLYLPMPYDRPTWDLTAVLYAVRPGHGYFGLSQPGTAHVSDEGVLHFKPEADGRHRYLIADDLQRVRAGEAQLSFATQPTSDLKRPPSYARGGSVRQAVRINAATVAGARCPSVPATPRDDR